MFLVLGSLFLLSPLVFYLCVLDRYFFPWIHVCFFGSFGVHLYDNVCSIDILCSDQRELWFVCRFSLCVLDRSCSLGLTCAFGPSSGFLDLRACSIFDIPFPPSFCLLPLSASFFLFFFPPHQLAALAKSSKCKSIGVVLPEACGEGSAQAIAQVYPCTRSRSMMLQERTKNIHLV